MTTLETKTTAMLSKVRVNQPLNQLTSRMVSEEIHARSNLTQLQTLYWLGQTLRGKSPVFNTVYTYTIDGNISEERFAEAFHSLVLQSDALRIVFDEEEDIPKQRVLNIVPREMEFIDLSGESQAEAVFQVWLRERTSHEFDLFNCSYDSALVKLSDHQFVWYFNQHHILVDASSFTILFQRLADVYSRLSQGEELALEEPPQFMDYVAYERESRRKAVSEKAREYWEKRLNPGPEPLTFFGFAPVKTSTRVRRVSYDLGEALSWKLRRATRREEIFSVSEEFSHYCVFGGLFFALLHKLSGRRRLGLVTPLDNRFNARFQDTVGLLLDFFPLLMQVDGTETLLDFVLKVKREMREVMSHYPYGYDLDSSSPAFDVMFNTYTIPALQLAGHPVFPERVHPGYGTESLALHVTDVQASGSFVLHFDLHEDVFPTDDVRQQVIQIYLDLLEAFLASPDSLLSSIRDWQVKSHADTALIVEAGSVNHLDFELAGKVPPKDLLEFQIFQAWQSIFGERLIGVNDNFFELGGNSWLAVRLFVEIERLTGKYLPLTSLIKAATIAEQAKIIRQETGGGLWSAVVTIQSGGGRRPIYFAPGAAENGLAVARIARHLGEERPVFMFQIPIDLSDTQEKPLRIEEIAQQYVRELLKLQPEGSYIVGGYSAGGLVALEAAQQLKRLGKNVDLLVVVDVPAQSAHYGILQRIIHRLGRWLHLHPRRERKLFLFFRDAFFRLDYFLSKGLYEMLADTGTRLARFLRADWQGKVLLVMNKLNPVEPTPITEKILPGSVEEGDQAWMDFDRHMREHFKLVNEAVKCYIPKPYAGHVLLFRSTMGYRRPEMRMADPLMGWKKLVTGKLDVHVIPGNHLHIVREPGVKQLGEILKSYLDALD